ncbi:hypothetical protein Acy02nite_89910 [Actinoplanes cyaneus]|uniref:Uncharacterized protein n=1 Tax=Actinoplanes cyaneus TaxID=52696 RepID=A0A919IZS3_9ACTN|nr:hypothetical protein Acy02nite_89910 [Actinoplanes cyaneus]
MAMPDHYPAERAMPEPAGPGPELRMSQQVRDLLGLAGVRRVQAMPMSRARCPKCHDCPGPRSTGVNTRNVLLSRPTLVNRPVCYEVATTPDRDRHGEPGCA